MTSQRNIPLMYIIKFCRGLLFSASIVYLFYNHYNLWTTELYIVQSVFAIGVVLFEIPTWFISDKYSRKASLVIWLLLSAIGFIIYSQWSSLVHFIIAELILVIGFCCMSGTDTALIYDSIAHDKISNNYKKVSGRYFSISSFAESLWGISGAYIALYGLWLPFVLDGVVAFIAFLVSIFLIEPPRTKLDSQEWSWIQIKRTLWHVYRHKQIRWLICFSALASTMTINMVWFSQPYMKLVWLPIIYVGRFWFIMNAGWSLVSLFIHKIEKIFTEKIFMFAIIIWWIISMMTIAFFPSLRLLPVFLLFQITRQWNRLISNDNLHILSDSSIRATVQSISSMAFRLTFAIWGPIFWWIYASEGLIPALGTSSCVIGGLALYAAWKFQHVNVKTIH